MKLQKKYEIEKATSTDETRYVLGFVHITEDKKHLIATDGRMLAKVPVEIEETDDIGSQSIPPSVLIDARKKSPRRSSECYLSLNGTFQHTDGVSVPRPSAEDVGHFPNYQGIIPKDPIIKHTVTLNPELLLALAKALGNSKCVTLEFQDVSGNPPVIVRNGEAFGLLMPLAGVVS